MEKLNKAYEFLESKLSEYKSNDMKPLKFLSGSVIALTLVLLFYLIAPPKSDADRLSNYHEVVLIFRWTLNFIFTLILCGLVIKYLKEFRINYVIIFDSHPANRIAQTGMYILAAILMIIWLLCMIGEVSVIKAYLPFEQDLFAIIMLVVFSVIFFNPIKLFQSVIRIQTIVAAFNWLFSPFSEVRFLEFYVADVMCSLAKPFIDIALITCWATSNSDENVFLNGECHPKMFWAIFAWYIPFHIRFWQCINRWWVTGDAFPHLVNSGKYIANISLIWSNYYYYFDPSLKIVVFALYMVVTIYSLCWDMFMDWGLLRDGMWLRKKILCPPKDYYVWAVINFTLRFAWLLIFIDSSYWPLWFRKTDSLNWVLAVLELIRRAIWSLFRLENENINNFEKYRTVLEIPRLPRD
jgi:xenotropic and polytropic retrovirus receptor 1